MQLTPKRGSPSFCTYSLILIGWLEPPHPHPLCNCFRCSHRDQNLLDQTNGPPGPAFCIPHIDQRDASATQMWHGVRCPPRPSTGIQRPNASGHEVFIQLSWLVNTNSSLSQSHTCQWPSPHTIEVSSTNCLCDSVTNLHFYTGWPSECIQALMGH